MHKKLGYLAFILAFFTPAFAQDNIKNYNIGLAYTCGSKTVTDTTQRGPSIVSEEQSPYGAILELGFWSKTEKSPLKLLLEGRYSHVNNADYFDLDDETSLRIELKKQDAISYFSPLVFFEYETSSSIFYDSSNILRKAQFDFIWIGTGLNFERTFSNQRFILAPFAARNFVGNMKIPANGYSEKPKGWKYGVKARAYLTEQVWLETKFHFMAVHDFSESISSSIGLSLGFTI